MKESIIRMLTYNQDTLEVTLGVIIGLFIFFIIYIIHLKLKLKRTKGYPSKVTLDEYDTYVHVPWPESQAYSEFLTIEDYEEYIMIGKESGSILVPLHIYFLINY